MTRGGCDIHRPGEMPFITSEWMALSDPWEMNKQALPLFIISTLFNGEANKLITDSPSTREELHSFHVILIIRYKEDVCNFPLGALVRQEKNCELRYVNDNNNIFHSRAIVLFCRALTWIMMCVI